jgi:hypothetical protein
MPWSRRFPVPPDSSHPKFQPLTVNVTDPIRDGLQKIADREILSLSDVVRRACLAEIKRRALGSLTEAHDA